MLVQVPREALEIAGTLFNFRYGKFGYSTCPFFSKGDAEIFREFWHDFAKKRDIWDIATNAWAGYLSTKLSDVFLIFVLLTFASFFVVQTCRPTRPALLST